MTAWGKVYGTLVFNKKFMPLSLGARGLWVSALSFSIAMKTHGVIEKHLLAVFGADASLAGELVENGLWEETPEGWVFHDWADYQSTEAVAERARANGAKGGRPRKNPEPVNETENLEEPTETQKNPEKPRDNPEETYENPEVSQKKLELELELNKDNVSKREVYSPEFIEFWETYPRKTDKRTAWRAWLKAVKETPPSVIIAGAVKYNHDPNRDPKYTKHASTWLNAGSWENEPEPARASPVQTGINAWHTYRALEQAS